MSVPSYELSTEPDGVVVRIQDRGSAVLASPTINRGTAFTMLEREALGLTGLLTPRVDNLEGQTRRAYAQYAEQANDLRRWVYLESCSVLEQDQRRGACSGVRQMIREFDGAQGNG